MSKTPRRVSPTVRKLRAKVEELNGAILILQKELDRRGQQVRATQYEMEREGRSVRSFQQQIEKLTARNAQLTERNMELASLYVYYKQKEVAKPDVD